MPTLPRPVFRFGPFELLVGPSALYREGQLVSITPKALATLAALVARHGTPISKEELLTTVWAGTAVEEASLSQNIYTLRKLLAPDFPDQNPIENIPRFGYRFSLPVIEAVAARKSSKEAPVNELPSDAADTLAPAEPVAQTFQADSEPQEPADIVPAATAAYQIRPKVRWAIAAVVVLAVFFAAVIYWRWPALESFIHPAPQYDWVPFTANSNENGIIAAALAPGGNLVAYADADGVVLREAQSTDIHSLSSPKMKAVEHLAWFPDQLHLLVSGQSVATGTPEVWKISVLGEAPLLLRDNARLGTVSHDGASIAFLSPDQSQAWAIGSDGVNPRRVVTADPGQQFSVLLWAPQDNGLLLERRTILLGGTSTTPTLDHPDHNATYERVNLSDGKRTAEDSTLSIGDACLVNGHDLIYSLSNSADGPEAVSLWRVHLNRATGAIVSAPVRVDPSDSHNHIYGFSCSASGDRIAVIRKEGATSTYTADLGTDPVRLSNVRRLSLNSATSFPHGWSADSNSVLYEAAPTANHWEIYSHPLGRHDPDQILSMTGSSMRPTPTADHRWLLFLHATPDGRKTLYRLGPQEKLPSAVPSEGGYMQFRCPLLQGDCVMLQKNERSETQFFVLDPFHGKDKLLATLPARLNPILDWDVSPDGDSLVVDTASDVPLHIVSLRTGKLTDVPFHSQRRTDAVNWSADGKGFFVASDTGSGDDVSFIDLAGNSTLLRTTSLATWMVPSPNGKHVAFIDRSQDSNVWLLQKK